MGFTREGFSGLPGGAPEARIILRTVQKIDRKLQNLSNFLKQQEILNKVGKTYANNTNFIGKGV